jgi:hypothetical protein
MALTAVDRRGLGVLGRSRASQHATLPASLIRLTHERQWALGR